MLTTLLSTLSLIILPLFFKNYWCVITCSLFILTLSYLPYLSVSFIYSISSFSMLDLMSSSLINLSLLVAALMMIASTKILTNKMNSKLFSMLNCTLLLILILCFSSSSLLLFYIWFEASLVPTMLIIMMWGYQPERIQASMYLIMYTVTASLPMLASLMISMNSSNHMLMSMWFSWYTNLSLNMNYMWLIMLLGFLVKLPMFTVHLWLPKAHVEAPIAGSMVLAAILLKLGGYGILRMIFLFNKVSSTLVSSLLLSISVIGAIVTSMICLRQSDIKSLIAYSSVGHMGLLLAAAMSNSNWAMWGSMMIMIAHGLCSSALFILANLTYEITHTRSMYLTKGVVAFGPTISMWWFLFSAWNMAAPPSINLLSEIMLLTSIISYSYYSIPLLMIISFLAAAYSLNMYTTTQHGAIPSFMKPSQVMKQKDMLLLMLHIIPIITLISKPEIISIWS